MKPVKIALVSDIQSVESKDGFVKLTLKTHEGNVDTTNISAKPAGLEGTLSLKKLAAHGVKLGSRVVIHISIEEEKDGMS